MGRNEQALLALETAAGKTKSAGYLIELARVQTAIGRVDDATAILQSLRARETRGETYSLDSLAYIAAAAGRNDEAFRVLQTLSISAWQTCSGSKSTRASTLCVPILVFPLFSREWVSHRDGPRLPAFATPLQNRRPSTLHVELKPATGPNQSEATT